MSFFNVQFFVPSHQNQTEKMWLKTEVCIELWANGIADPPKTTIDHLSPSKAL